MFYVAWERREDLEAAKPWVMFESQGVAHWKVKGSYQPMLTA